MNNCKEAENIRSDEKIVPIPTMVDGVLTIVKRIARKDPYDFRREERVETPEFPPTELAQNE